MNPGPRKGFTLIEVVISVALMSLILFSAYLCLSAGFSTQKTIEPRIETLQNARVALALIVADLRSACPLSSDSAFLGMTRMIGETQADNLDFGTHNFVPKRPSEGDFCQESIYLDKNLISGRYSLWRRRNPGLALDPLSGGSKEEIATGVEGFKLEYYDGIDWYDSWGPVKGQAKADSSLREVGNLSGLPLAVRITLYLEGEREGRIPGLAQLASKKIPPMVFQTVARLNLSEAVSGGTGSGSPIEAAASKAGS